MEYLSLCVCVSVYMIVCSYWVRTVRGVFSFSVLFCATQATPTNVPMQVMETAAIILGFPLVIATIYRHHLERHKRSLMLGHHYLTTTTTPKSNNKNQSLLQEIRKGGPPKKRNHKLFFSFYFSLFISLFSYFPLGGGGGRCIVVPLVSKPLWQLPRTLRKNNNETIQALYYDKLHLV